MLREHFEGDEDAEEKIACLQEFFGACLFGVAVRFQKCLALPSDGGGGRSTTLEIIEKAMPHGAVIHIDARELRKPERRAKLPGKLLGFSDEVPGDAFLEAEDFKKIVTGNVVTGEEKYRPSFEFRAITGLVFPIQVSAGAELTEAFFRRFILIRYNRRFHHEKKRILDLAEKIITAELPGVVAWMLEGAARLMKQGKYTMPKSHGDEESRWKLAADTVHAFLESMYTRSLFEAPRKQGYDEDGRPNGQEVRMHDWTPSIDLYDEYRKWGERSGHRKLVATQEFKRRVEAIGYPCVHTRAGNYYGVRLISRAIELSEKAARASRGLPPPVIGAVSILHRGSKLQIVKNTTT
jgi:phage/plasmid-associated DNA primase